MEMHNTTRKQEAISAANNIPKCITFSIFCIFCFESALQYDYMST